MYLIKRSLPFVFVTGYHFISTSLPAHVCHIRKMRLNDIYYLHPGTVSQALKLVGLLGCSAKDHGTLLVI
jgi:hypothetical protein